MPENAVYVGRPTKYGNRHKVGDIWREIGTDEPYALTTSNALSLYRRDLAEALAKNPNFLNDLRGKDLACFCPLGQPCHADILLECANRLDNEFIRL